MKLHRNSQKRFYDPGRPIFITTNTYKRYPYFEEDIFCELFTAELEFCRELMDFKTAAYKINPDHVHLLITPGNEHNYSEIMHFIKRNSSRNINNIIGFTQLGKNIISSDKSTIVKGDDDHRRLCTER